MPMTISSTIGAGFVQMQKMDSFKDGKTNLTKDDLLSIESAVTEGSRATPEDLKAIIENYEAINTNGDGMSFNELSSYAEENNFEPGGPFGK